MKGAIVIELEGSREEIEGALQACLREARQRKQAPVWYLTKDVQCFTGREAAQTIEQAREQMDLFGAMGGPA